MKRMRRRWYELNESAKMYVERNVAKWEKMGRPHWMLELPRDFTCFQSRKDVPIEESLHRVLVISLARPKGALEYDMLEMERLTFRRIPSERNTRRKIRREVFNKMKGWENE